MALEATWGVAVRRRPDGLGPAGGDPLLAAVFPRGMPGGLGSGLGELRE